jgi:hypothetical protein
MIEHQGQYGYTTDIDSLKNKSRDGYLDYIDKVGWWFYYNDKGFLTRKEHWNKGKLVGTIYYQTSVMPKTNKKQPGQSAANNSIGKIAADELSFNNKLLIKGSRKR